MAKKKEETDHKPLLPLETQIEVICTKGERVIKQIMTYGDSLQIVKKEGWKYINYQLGFSSFIESK